MSYYLFIIFLLEKCSSHENRLTVTWWLLTVPSWWCNSFSNNFLLTAPPWRTSNHVISIPWPLDEQLLSPVFYPARLNGQEWVNKFINVQLITKQKMIRKEQCDELTIDVLLTRRKGRGVTGWRLIKRKLSTGTPLLPPLLLFHQVIIPWVYGSLTNN